jgi:germination protein M
MNRLICIITLCLVLVTILSACGILEKLGLKDTENDELRPVSSIVMNEDEAEQLADKAPVRLYFANDDNTKLLMEIRYIPMSEVKKSVNNLASVIVEELIKGPLQNTRLKATIPEDTKLCSPVSIDAGIATVDLTKHFIDNHPGGKEAEQITIYSIVNSLTELKEIQKVRFTIDGKESTEFKGHFQFDAPFPRSASLISDDPPVRSTTAGGESKELRGKDKQDGKIEDDKKEEGPQETFDEYGEPLDGLEDTFDFEELDEDSEETYIEILE